MPQIRIRSLMIAVALTAVVLRFADDARTLIQDRNNYTWPDDRINPFTVLVLLVIAPAVGLFARQRLRDDIDWDQRNDVPK
ncbi:hypothetical protein ACYOEI_17975 [Singulisphaera rosea]